ENGASAEERDEDESDRYERAFHRGSVPGSEAVVAKSPERSEEPRGLQRGWGQRRRHNSILPRSASMGHLAQELRPWPRACTQASLPFVDPPYACPCSIAPPFAMPSPAAWLQLRRPSPHTSGGATDSGGRTNFRILIWWWCA